MLTKNLRSAMATYNEIIKERGLRRKELEKPWRIPKKRTRSKRWSKIEGKKRSAREWKRGKNLSAINTNSAVIVAAEHTHRSLSLPRPLRQSCLPSPLPLQSRTTAHTNSLLDWDYISDYRDTNDVFPGDCLLPAMLRSLPTAFVICRCITGRNCKATRLIFCLSTTGGETTPIFGNKI